MNFRIETRRKELNINPESNYITKEENKCQENFAIEKKDIEGAKNNFKLAEETTKATLESNNIFFNRTVNATIAQLDLCKDIRKIPEVIFKYAYNAENDFKYGIRFRNTVLYKLKNQRKPDIRREFKEQYSAWLKNYKKLNPSTTNFPDLPEGVIQNVCGSFECNSDGIFNSDGKQITEGYVLFKDFEKHDGKVIVNMAVKGSEAEKSWNIIEKVPLEDLFDKRKVQKTLNPYSLSLTDTKALAITDYFSELVLRNISDCRLTSVKWTDKSKAELDFLPYDHKELKWSDEMLQNYTVKGDKEKWNKCLNDAALKSRGAKLAMIASTASMIVAKKQALPFIFFLHGDASSGKSLFIKTAASMWGNRYIVKEIDGSTSANAVTLGNLNCLPAFFDDLQAGDKHKKNDRGNFDELIYAMCKGSDKTTLRRTREIIRTQTWNNSILLSGEEYLVKENSLSGSNLRVLTYEMKGVECKEMNPDEMFEVTHENYGFIWDYIKEYIVGNKKEELEKYIQESKKELLRHAHGAAGKSVTTLSYLMAAEKMLIASDFFNEEENMILLPTREYLDLIEQDTLDYTDRAYEVVCDYIGTRRNYITSTSCCDDKYGNQVGYTMSDGRKCLYKTELKDYLSKHGFDDFKLILKNFARRNYIETDSSGHFDKLIKISGKLERMVVFNTLKLEDEEE
jgi:hypothetical protein